MSKVKFTFDKDALEQHNKEVKQALARELIGYFRAKKHEYKYGDIALTMMLGFISEIAEEGNIE